MSVTIQVRLKAQSNSKIFYMPIEITANSFLDCLKDLDKLEKDLASRYLNRIVWEIDFPVRLYDKDEF